MVFTKCGTLWGVIIDGGFDRDNTPLTGAKYPLYPKNQSRKANRNIQGRLRGWFFQKTSKKPLAKADSNFTNIPTIHVGIEGAPSSILLSRNAEISRFAVMAAAFANNPKKVMIADR